MADTSQTTSRRRFLETLGATGAAAVAGCSTQGSDPTPEEEPTPEKDTTQTPENDTETPDNTTSQETPEKTTEEPEETPEEDNTTEEKNPGPNYDSLEEVYRNEVIQDDYLTHQIDENWDIIRSELEEQGHNLSDPEITEEFIEDIATHGAVHAPFNQDQNTGAQAYAHILYNKLEVSPEEVLVAARTRNDQGHPTPITSILAQTESENNGYTKTLYQHRSNEEMAQDNPDNSLVLSPSEDPFNTAEEAFTDMWNPDRPLTVSWLDDESFRSRMEYTIEEQGGSIDRSIEDIQRSLVAKTDNIVVGANDKDVNGGIVFTPEASQVKSEVLDFNNINANPNTVGQVAHDLVSKTTLDFYNEVQPQDDRYLAVGFDGDIDADPSQYSFDDFEFNYVEEDGFDEIVKKRQRDFLESAMK